MTRQTRCGKHFSPYELEDILSSAPEAGRPFDVIRLDISLDEILQHGVVDADRRAAHADDSAADGDDGWEDDVNEEMDQVTSSPPSCTSSPLSSYPTSAASSRAVSPATLPPAPPYPAAARPALRVPAGSPPRPRNPVASTSASPSAAPQIQRQLDNARAHARRSKRRQAAHAKRSPYDRTLDPRYRQTHREQPPHAVPFDMVDAPVAAGGSWLGRRSKGSSSRLWTLSELKADGDTLIKWNGRDPKLIVDSHSRIIAILQGKPEDPDWDDVIEDVARAMRCARSRARRHGAWQPGDLHRRGRYFLLTSGVSFGGGQRKPGNLCNTRFKRRLIRMLLQRKSIRRVLGFQSAGLAMYAPKLYQYLCDNLRLLFEHHPELSHNTTNSILPAVSFNCGDAVTLQHCDLLNLAHGLCPITSAGDYDPKTGGHLYLKQLKLVIEFPPGATIAITSGCVDHGNTPIRPGETRFSTTQFAAGGLFRWVAYGFQTAKSLLSQQGGRAIRDSFDGVPGSRWRWALGLFSKVDELEADRAAVFGSGR